MAYAVPIDDLLKELVAAKGSDLHIHAGEPPLFRIHGRLTRTKHPVFSADDTNDLLAGVAGEDRFRKFQQKLELDLAYELGDIARFRVNVFKQQDAVGSVMRLIPLRIQSIDELGLPPVLKNIIALPRGLILVTGPTGSGKSTSLAAMIDYLNTSQTKHIITVEDPIEFLHRDKMSTIEQRELEVDTHSYASALRHIMRQNPDVILIGEMRDLETMQLALTAAETGHLVLSTVHTTDAAQTCDRIIDVFEPEKQAQIRTQLAVTLQAVISQTLLPKADGQGRVAAFEILVVTPAARHMIREGKTHQLYSVLQTGGDQQMQLLDNHLLDLYRQNLVTFEEALAKSSNPLEFRQRAGMVHADAAAAV